MAKPIMLAGAALETFKKAHEACELGKPLLRLAETATEPVLVHVRAGCKLTCLRRKDTHVPLPFVAARWSVTHPVLCTTGFVS